MANKVSISYDVVNDHGIAHILTFSQDDKDDNSIRPATTSHAFEAFLWCDANYEERILLLTLKN